MLGERIVVQLTLRNDGSDLLIVPYVPADPSIRWRIADERGASVSYVGPFVSRIACARAELSPGNVLSGFQELTGLYDLSKPGLYQATALYSENVDWPIASHQKPGPPNWTGRVESNEITFRIDPVPPEEAEAHRRFKAIKVFNEGLGQATEFLGAFPRSTFAPHVIYGIAAHTMSIAGNGKDPRSWLLRYGKALDRLRELKQGHPGFLSELVNQRVAECEREIAKARGAVELK